MLTTRCCLSPRLRCKYLPLFLHFHLFIYPSHLINLLLYKQVFWTAFPFVQSKIKFAPFCIFFNANMPIFVISAIWMMIRIDMRHTGCSFLLCDILHGVSSLTINQGSFFSSVSSSRCKQTTRNHQVLFWLLYLLLLFLMHNVKLNFMEIASSCQLVLKPRIRDLPLISYSSIWQYEGKLHSFISPRRPLFVVFFFSDLWLRWEPVPYELTLTGVNWE